jgi:hypothetical protein
LVSSEAVTPDAYLGGLVPERREVVSAVRDMVNAHLPSGYLETMAWGMISWVVPLDVYPETYNGQPLAYAGLAAQKNYTSLYLMALYNGGPIGVDDLRERWAAARPPDLGKSCVRFRRLDDIDLPLLAQVVGSVPLDRFVAAAREAHSRSR